MTPISDMPARRRGGTLLGLALAAVVAVGCSPAATPDMPAAPPAEAGSGVTAAPDRAADAPAVSEASRQEAQRIAEEAEKIMLDPALPPREKYPKALGMFRDALQIDPGNALSKDSITLIEDIYRSMGRPVPEPT